jgi:hypothetical protein
MFDAKLSPEVSGLLLEVENLFGKQRISERVNREWGEDRLGYSNIDDYGAPYIEINDALGRTKDNIAHELLHLRLMALGFGKVSIKTWDRELDQFFKSSKADGLSVVVETVGHSIFFPTMLKWGLAPGGHYDSPVFRRDLSEIDKNHSAFDQRPTTLTSIYFTALMETRDRAFVRRTAESWVRYGWKDALDRGQEMADIVESAALSDPPRSDPKEMDAMLAKLLNVLYRGKMTFEAAGIEQRKYSTYTLPVLVVWASRTTG